MPLLIIVSFIWAFSYGLIKGRLAGLDPTAVATVRLAIALVVFLPFLRSAPLNPAAAVRLTLVGTFQFGVMYLVYLRAFAYLPAYAVALFTITTPLYLVAIDAIRTRCLAPRQVAAALLATLAAAVMVARDTGLSSEWLIGCGLVQVSNLCFAAGQIAWRAERAKLPASVTDASLFALPYLGALLVTALTSAFATDWAAFRPTSAQAVTLIYLGAIASGLAFFLWNKGATRVGTGTLAVLNNAKVPLAVACSLLFFGEASDPYRLTGSFALLGAALWLARPKPSPVSARSAP